MKIIIVLFLVTISFTSFAQQEIKIEDAINHVGDSVKICSKIYGGKYQGKRMEMALWNEGISERFGFQPGWFWFNFF